MSILLRVVIIISGFILIYCARKASVARKMTERQSLFWIIGGLIISIFGVVPSLVYFISNIFKVAYPPSIIFTIAIVIAVYGIFNCYRMIAQLQAKVQELAMQVSLNNEEKNTTNSTNCCECELVNKQIGSTLGKSRENRFEEALARYKDRTIETVLEDEMEKSKDRSVEKALEEGIEKNIRLLMEVK